jgi:hypothetical protein
MILNSSAKAEAGLSVTRSPEGPSVYAGGPSAFAGPLQLIVESTEDSLRSVDRQLEMRRAYRLAFGLWQFG